MFTGSSGGANLLALREVLALFGAQVTCGVRKPETNRMDRNDHVHIRKTNTITYSTNLPIEALAHLKRADSFPIIEELEQKELAVEANRKAEIAQREKEKAEREIQFKKENPRYGRFA